MGRIISIETLEKIGEPVTLCGWVNSHREHGKIVFIDLRDRSGIVQIVASGELAAEAKKLRKEYVIEVKGEVKKRPKTLVNPDIETGAIEIKAETIKILAEAKNPPFDISSEGHNIDEQLRLQYRYLDLRRPRMANNLRVRNKAIQFIRKYLLERDFCEIETPILTKSTPEGARDFIVPSRLQPGKFYALPQSPQQYKQLLIVAGFERYFQIARCFRDEDPRADRAYGEFTQLDLEMSFVTQEDILQITESLFTQMVEEIWPDKRIKEKPWPRLTHKEAIEKYGTDKPDLRDNKDDSNELAFSWTIGFPLFTKQTKDDYFHGAGENLAPSHHMFTAPHPNDIDLLETEPLKVRGLQHDMVLNGYEVGGGSIRIHEAKIQEKVFELIGFEEEQKKEFEHMLTAFEYGVPPHGGIAPGIDRLLMVILGEPSLREVIAFPTSGAGETAVMNAPSEVDRKQLTELGLKVVKKENEN